MKTEFELSPHESDLIRSFWDQYGVPNFGMLSQPVMRENGYVLKIRMFTMTQADLIYAFLEELSRENDAAPVLPSRAQHTGAIVT
jgi:hypothetical protein